jgi:DMSO/TMAO reductase YedYZ molybdopterin-dependent catalytic subunit
MDRYSRRDLLRLGLLTPFASRFALAKSSGPELIVRSSRPQDLETPVSALLEEFTPNDLFFVRSHFGPPLIDLKEWRFEIAGEVERPARWTLQELQQSGSTSRAAVLQCAGNGRTLFNPRIAGAQWERGAVGQALWTGVKLSDVLTKAGLKSDAKFITFVPGDHPMASKVPPFRRSIPIEKALEDVVLAWQMNRVALPLLHGAPLRAVVPGWAGNHWVKWLRGIEVTTKEDPGFYMQTGYKFPTEPIPPGGKPKAVKSLTEIPVKSLIVKPAAAARLRVGNQRIEGVAFGGRGPITRVQVSVDDGETWSDAQLDPAPVRGAWQRWDFDWIALSGSYVLRARATDSAGSVQPKEPAWNPSGYLYNAWDEVRCEVGV